MSGRLASNVMFTPRPSILVMAPLSLHGTLLKLQSAFTVNREATFFLPMKHLGQTSTCWDDNYNLSVTNVPNVMAGSHSILYTDLEFALLHLLTWDYRNASLHLILIKLFIPDVSSCYIFILLIQHLSTIYTRELILP